MAQERDNREHARGSEEIGRPLRRTWSRPVVIQGSVENTATKGTQVGDTTSSGTVVGS